MMAIKIFVLLLVLIIVSTFREIQAQPINANTICTAEEVSELTSVHLKALDEEINNANLLIQHLTESTNGIKYSEESLKLQEDLDKTKGTVKVLNTKVCTFETQLIFYFKLSKLDAQESKCATNSDKDKRSLKNKVHSVLQKTVFDKFKVTFALRTCRSQVFYGGCWLFSNCCQQALTQLTNKIASAINKIESSIAQAELNYNNCLKKVERAALQIETDITKELLKCKLEENEDQSSEPEGQSESSTGNPNLGYSTTNAPAEPSDVASNTETEIQTELPSQNNDQENKPSTEVVLQLPEQGNTQETEAETEILTEIPLQDNETNVSSELPEQGDNQENNIETEVSTILPEQSDNQNNEQSTEVLPQLLEQGKEQENEPETAFPTEFPERNNDETEISTQLPQQSDNQENYIEEISSEFPKQNDNQENGSSTEVVSQFPEQNEILFSTEFPEHINHESTKFPEESDNQDSRANTEVSIKLPEQDNRENESDPEQNNIFEPEIVTEIPDQSYLKNETKTEASSETPGLANGQENELDKDTSIGFLETGHIEEIRTDTEVAQSSHEKDYNQDYGNKVEGTEQDSNVENEYGYEIQQEDNSHIQSKSASDSESSEEFDV